MTVVEIDRNLVDVSREYLRDRNDGGDDDYCYVGHDDDGDDG